MLVAADCIVPARRRSPDLQVQLKAHFQVADMCFVFVFFLGGGSGGEGSAKMGLFYEDTIQSTDMEPRGSLRKIVFQEPPRFHVKESKWEYLFGLHGGKGNNKNASNSPHLTHTHTKLLLWLRVSDWIEVKGPYPYFDTYPIQGLVSKQDKYPDGRFWSDLPLNDPETGHRDTPS